MVVIVRIRVPIVAPLAFAHAVALHFQLVTLTVGFLAVRAFACAPSSVLQGVSHAGGALEEFVFESLGVAFQNVNSRRFNLGFVAFAIVAVFASALRAALLPPRKAVTIHL